MIFIHTSYTLYYMEKEAAHLWNVQAEAVKTHELVTTWSWYISKSYSYSTIYYIIHFSVPVFEEHKLTSQVSFIDSRYVQSQLDYLPGPSQETAIYWHKVSWSIGPDSWFGTVRQIDDHISISTFCAWTSKKSPIESCCASFAFFGWWTSCWFASAAIPSPLQVLPCHLPEKY